MVVDKPQSTRVEGASIVMKSSGFSQIRVIAWTWAQRPGLRPLRCRTTTPMFFVVLL